MITWVIENKDWLFSGIGIIILTIVYNLFFKKVNYNDNNITVVVQHEDTKNKDNSSEQIPTEVSLLKYRFNETLILLNEDTNQNEFTITKLAQILKIHKISELEDFFLGKAEPTIEFVKEYAYTFGINEEWLLEGKGEPFYNNFNLSESDPYKYVKLINELNPKNIYFIKNDSEIAQFFIVLQINNWKYITLRKTYHLSSHVGGEGSSQIYGFYKLINELRTTHYTLCQGVILKNKDFDDLLYGKKFQQKYFNFFKKQINYWWDDFTDIHHLHPMSEKYEKRYGLEFIKAQEIAKAQEIVKNKKHIS